MSSFSDSPLIFFGSNGIGLTSNFIGFPPEGAALGVCAAAGAGQIGARPPAPAVSADPGCTTLRRSRSVVMVPLHPDCGIVRQSSGVIAIVSKCVTLSALVHNATLPGLTKVLS